MLAGVAGFHAERVSMSSAAENMRTLGRPTCAGLWAKAYYPADHACFRQGGVNPGQRRPRKSNRRGGLFRDGLI